MRTITLLLFLVIAEFTFSQNGFVVDHRHTDLSQIPDEYITAAKQNLKIRYFRRSHGSQLDVGGMTALALYTGGTSSKYIFSKTGASGSLFLSTQGSTEWNSLDFENATWVSITRNYLDDAANAAINVVMWAWSSNFYQCSATQYVNDMEMLISEYGPGGSKNRAVPVTFIFQTACGQKSGERNQLVFNGNKVIRDHCNTHGRILFDFNDLECYNPDGQYFGDADESGNYTSARLLADDLSYKSGSSRGNWGIEWVSANSSTDFAKMSGPTYCAVCEHSDGKDNSMDARINCVLKGHAAWWMWAVLAGWDAGTTPTSIWTEKLDKEKQIKNYPNPFDNTTIIEYEIEKNAAVKLSVWDSSGKLITVLVDGNQGKGKHQVQVSLSNRGIYFYTLEVDGKKTFEKMIKM